MRITGVDLGRWAAVASAIIPLLADALPRLDQERVAASVKREKKIAAGRKGADARWGDGRTNANANGKGMAGAMAEPMRNQWPSASDEALSDEGLAPTRTPARETSFDHSPDEKITRRFDNKDAAGAWLSAVGAFPGDPAFDRCVSKLVEGSATWGDVNRAAA